MQIYKICDSHSSRQLVCIVSFISQNNPLRYCTGLNNTPPQPPILVHLEPVHMSLPGAIKLS